MVSVTHEGPASTITVTDGTNTYTKDPNGIKNNSGSNGEPHQCLFYCLSLAAGTFTPTANFGTSSPFTTIICQFYTPSATPTYKASSSGEASTGTAFNTGNITTTAGTIDGVAFVGYAEYGANMTVPKINGVAFEQQTNTPGGRYTAWSVRYSTGYTGAGTGTLDASNRWTGGIIALEIGGAAATVKQLAALGVG